MWRLIKWLFGNIGPYILGIMVGIGFAAILLTFFSPHTDSLTAGLKSLLGEPDKAALSEQKAHSAKPAGSWTAAIESWFRDETSSKQKAKPAAVSVKPAANDATAANKPKIVWTLLGDQENPSEGHPPAKPTAKPIANEVPAPVQVPHQAPVVTLPLQNPSSSANLATAETHPVVADSGVRDSSKSAGTVAMNQGNQPPYAMPPPVAGNAVAINNQPSAPMASQTMNQPASQGQPPGMAMPGNAPMPDSRAVDVGGLPASIPGCQAPTNQNPYAMNQFYACFWHQTCLNRMAAARQMIEQGKARCQQAGVNVQACVSYYSTLAERYRPEMCDQWQGGSLQ